MRSVTLFAVASLFLSGCFANFSGIALADDLFRVVALSDQNAPGTFSGAKFQQFAGITLNDSGQIAFFATLQQGAGDTNSDNDAGIWSESGGSLDLIAREGSQVAGLSNGTRFESLTTFPTINNSGQTAFTAALQLGSSVTNSNNIGLWIRSGDTLQLAVRHGDPVTEISTDAQIASINNYTFNDIGQVAFVGEWRNGPNIGASTLKNDGVWSGMPGLTNLVATQGDSLPGLPVGTTLDSPDFVHLNNLGQIVFRGYYYAGDTRRRSAIWSDAGGELYLVARNGQPAPSIAPAVNYGSILGPRINDQGKVSFTATYSGAASLTVPGTGNAIWTSADSTSSPIPVVRAGDPAPGTPTGATFGAFWDPIGFDSDQVAFRAILTPGAGGVTSENWNGIWSFGANGLYLVAREGDHAPGTSTGNRFDGVAFPSINELGQVAFYASLEVGTGNTTLENSHGIWAQDIFGTLRLVIRTGDWIDVDDGPDAELRMVESLEFLDAFNGTGRRKGINDRGQIAYIATFGDGSSGVFVSSAVAIPEPGSEALASAALAMAMLCRQRNLTKTRVKIRSAAPRTSP